ncbi:lipoate--protein ligase [Romboutsia sp.]|uniref:lipoate--protein ligase n=1 Tax=Romboutsia sp. TaxID=1965302 RepID=UPI003F3F9629
MLLIYNNKTNPYFNLAMEEYLLKNFNEDMFILWRNEPSIIVGKNQNTLSEINLEYVKEHSIPVIRRQSGGGAVFHDLGNINFTFISANNNSFSDFKRFTTPIIELLKTLDVNAEFSGRNDLLIDGRKFSGNAQYNYKDKVMHHGTLLFSSQIADLSNALKVKPIKFEGKSVKSVKSRVTNISEHLKTKINILEFKDLIMSYLAELNKDNTPYTLSDSDIDVINKLVEEKYICWDWNFGNSPKYSLLNELKYPGGNIEFNLNVEKGIIKDIRFFGDFFGKCDISFVEEILSGIRHEESSIKKVLSTIDINSYFLGADLDILVSGIMGVSSI